MPRASGTLANYSEEGGVAGEPVCAPLGSFNRYHAYRKRPSYWEKKRVWPAVNFPPIASKQPPSYSMYDSMYVPFPSSPPPRQARQGYCRKWATHAQRCISRDSPRTDFQSSVTPEQRGCQYQNDKFFGMLLTRYFQLHPFRHLAVLQLAAEAPSFENRSMRVSCVRYSPCPPPPKKTFF